MWMKYFEIEASRPNRSDYYLMQIAQKVHNKFNDNYISDLNKFKLVPVDSDCSPQKREVLAKDDVKGRTVSSNTIKGVWAARLTPYINKKEKKL